MQRETKGTLMGHFADGRGHDSDTAKCCPQSEARNMRLLRLAHKRRDKVAIILLTQRLQKG